MKQKFISFFKSWGALIGLAALVTGVILGQLTSVIANIFAFVLTIIVVAIIIINDRISK